MGCNWYLALTAAEMLAHTDFHPIAWMACHFSSSGPGLGNLPPQLPPDSIVILDDSIPLTDQDPHRIAAQLQLLEPLAGVLLDLQRKSNQAPELIHVLADTLSCPVAVTQNYAHDADCAVLLSPELNIPLSQAVAPWKDRQIWLDIPFGAQTFTVTEQGCEVSRICPEADCNLPHWDQALHCHYGIQILEDRACFTLSRTPEALEALLQEAESLNIPIAISLYQEYHRSQ